MKRKTKRHAAGGITDKASPISRRWRTRTSLCRRMSITQSTLCALAVGLLLLLAPCTLAEDAFYWTGEDEGLYSAARVGDEMYAMGRQGLFALDMKTGESRALLSSEEIQRLEIGVEQVMLIGGDRPLYYEGGAKRLYPIDGRVLRDPLNVEDTVLGDERMQIAHPILAGDTLYMVACGEDDMPAQARIHALNLETLRGDMSAAQGFEEILPYRDGELLALRNLGGTSGKEIVTVDMRTLETGEVLAVLPDARDFGLALDADGKMLAVSAGMISQWTDGAWKPIRAIPRPLWVYAAACTPAHYILASENGLRFYDRRDFPEQTLLRIVGSVSVPYEEKKFMNGQTSIAVSRRMLDHLCAEEIYTAVQTGDDEADLFCVRMSLGLRTLMERGFLEPMTDSETIRQDHQRLYEAFAAPLEYAGEIYAAPVMAWDMSCWRTRAAGGVPETIGELLTGKAAWEAEGEGPYVADAHRASAWRRMDYLKLLYEQYVMAVEREGEAVSFDDPVWIGLLERIGTLDEEAQAPEERADERVAGRYAQEWGLNLSGWDQGGVAADAPPRIDRDAPPQVPAGMYVYVINPLSKNKEAALAYLEYVVAHRSNQDQALLDATVEAGVLADSGVSALCEQLEELKARIGEAEEEDRIHMADKIAQLEAQIPRELEKPENWSVYEPLLAAYRTNIAPYLNLRLSPYLETERVTHGGVYESMMETLARYAAGGLTAQACARQMDDLSHRMHAEIVTMR